VSKSISLPSSLIRTPHSHHRHDKRKQNKPAHYVTWPLVTNRFRSFSVPNYVDPVRCVALRYREAPHVDACCKLMQLSVKKTLMSNSIKFDISTLSRLIYRAMHFSTIVHTPEVVCIIIKEKVSTCKARYCCAILSVCMYVCCIREPCWCGYSKESRHQRAIIAESGDWERVQKTTIIGVFNQSTDFTITIAFYFQLSVLLLHIYRS